MREIKFRARNLVTGDVLTQLYMGQCFQWVNQEHQHNIIIEQFTGLQDKNGIDIYDGDVIPYRGKNYAVKYIAPCFTFEGCDEVFLHNVPELQDWSEFEVIGNIHQNPELLES